MEYLKQYGPLNKRLAGKSQGDSDGGQKRKKHLSTAKVAFMITKQQRVILMQDHHFVQDEIKRLTPIEANIILERGFSALDPNWRSKVDQCLLSLNEEKDEFKASNSEVSNNTASSKNDIPVESLKLDMDIGFEQNLKENSDMNNQNALAIVDTVDSLEPGPLKTHPTALHDEAGDAVNSQSNQDTYLEDIAVSRESVKSNEYSNNWYEVIESVKVQDNDGNWNEEVCAIALFKTEEEAQECAKIKEELWWKRRSDTTDGSDKPDLESEQQKTVKFSFRTKTV